MTKSRLSSSAPLASSRVSLSIIRPRDYPTLYEMAIAEENLGRWIFYGGTPTFEQFVATFTEGVLCQFAIASRANSTIGGICRLTHANFRHGTANLSTVIAPEFQGSLWPMEGLVLFINYAFVQFRIRKLYVEVPGVAYQHMEDGLARLFDLEGLLRDHEWHLGRYWDTRIMSLTPQGFSDRMGYIIERIVSPS